MCVRVYTQYNEQLSNFNYNPPKKLSVYACVIMYILNRGHTYFSIHYYSCVIFIHYADINRDV